jgi:two-component system response regulator
MAGSGIVLLVEDNDDDARLIVRAFREDALPGRVEVVQSGAEAVAYVSGAPPYDDPGRHPAPALIILDLKMPVVDGYEVLKAIRACDGLRLVPVVVLTGVGDAASVKRTFELGASVYFVKPSGGRGFARVAREIENYWQAFSENPSG